MSLRPHALSHVGVPPHVERAFVGYFIEQERHGARMRRWLLRAEADERRGRLQRASSKRRNALGCAKSKYRVLTLLRAVRAEWDVEYVAPELAKPTPEMFGL